MSQPLQRENRRRIADMAEGDGRLDRKNIHVFRRKKIECCAMALPAGRLTC